MSGCHLGDSHCSQKKASLLYFSSSVSKVTVSERLTSVPPYFRGPGGTQTHGGRATASGSRSSVHPRPLHLLRQAAFSGELVLFCCPSAGAEGSQLSAAGRWRLLCLLLLGESSFSAGQMGSEKGGWEPGCSGPWDMLSPELWNLEE